LAFHLRIVLAKHVQIQFLVLVLLISQFTDALEFLEHLLIDERFFFSVQDFFDTLIDTLAVGFTSGSLPALIILAVDQL